ncbi:hypothetical protein BVRB_9g210890 [Beta vulgaris subsp. vulgaris]|nr:hypothetical protein BVRB_9g210890 [Beta vulgaris subsp. vulgaris]
MDIDYAIRKDEPLGITETSTPDAIDLYEKWERSNCLSVMFIKTKISASIRGSVDKHTKVKDLLKAIDEQFASSDKALASTIIMQFSSIRLTGIKGVRDHIMRMRDIAAQLKDLEVTISDTFLVHYILCTLPHQYGPFKVSYNTHKDKWSINELMTMCVQEEGRLVMKEGEKVNLTTFAKKKKDHTKDKEKGQISANQVIKKESSCCFCKKKGHMKKDCVKFKAWLKKKDMKKFLTVINMLLSKIKNTQRKSTVNSLSLLAEQNTVMESTKFCADVPGILRRGLEVINSHQQNVSKSSVAFSFEHLMLKPSPTVDRTSASVQTLSDCKPSSYGSPSSFLCISCRQKGQHMSNEVEDSLKTWIVTANKEGTGSDVSQASDEQNCNNNDENQEPEVIKETCDIGDKRELSNIGSFDMREKEELLAEIQLLKSKLQSYTDAITPNKSIDKLRSSLLSRSMQIRKSMSSQLINNAEDLEKERERWTEMESEWINLTDELRIDIVAHRQHAEQVEMDLQQQKKYVEELDDALHRSVLGHARFVEHYVDLQEEYNHLSESHRRIMETVTDVKKAAAKAGTKGSGARYAKAFAAELSTMRAEEKRERERLRRENKGLRLQLRETAEAVQTAGELLVRLREAEEAASLAEVTKCYYTHY